MRYFLMPRVYFDNTYQITILTNVGLCYNMKLIK
jgi:hypothetical protein